MLDVSAVRVVAAVLLVVGAAGVAALARTLSRRPGKVVASRRTVWGSEAAWLSGTAVAQAWTIGVLVLPVWFYDWPGVGNFPDSTAIQILGPVLWLLGMGLAGWSTRTLGRFMTVSIQVTEGHRLVQEGPYAWIRHPIYTGNVTAAVGLALLYLSPPLIAVAILLLVLATYRGRLEDAFLRSPQAFGPAYAEYSSRTGRFLPRFRRTEP